MSEQEKADKQTSKKPNTADNESEATMPQDDVCQKAPEWAEHARLHDDDEPCDDGRSGNIERDPRK